MRKLTMKDLMNVCGTATADYIVERVRIKGGTFTDSDNYGIVLAKNASDNYVTWQFHLKDNGKPDFYWGHYFGENLEAAQMDYDSRT